MEVTKKPSLGDGKREGSKESYRPGPFDYQRLDAFRVARKALVREQELVRRLPRGQSGLLQRTPPARQQRRRAPRRETC